MNYAIILKILDKGVNINMLNVIKSTENSVFHGSLKTPNPDKNVWSLVSVYVCY